MLNAAMNNKRRASISIDELSQLGSTLGPTDLAAWTKGQHLLEKLNAERTSDLDDTELAAAHQRCIIPSGFTAAGAR